jgi:hypothetical protein
LRAVVQGATPAPFVDPISEPPPVRTPAPVVVVAEQSVRALPLDEAPAEPIDVDLAPMPVGRDTVRLIRRVRRRMHRTPRRVAMVALAAAAAFAWFSPTTRAPTRAACQRAGAQMQMMLERVLPNRELRP